MALCIYLWLNSCWSGIDRVHLVSVVMDQRPDSRLPQWPITALRVTVCPCGCSIRITVTPSTWASTTTACTAWRRPGASVRAWVSCCLVHEGLELVFIWSNCSPPILFFFFFSTDRCSTADLKIQRGERLCVKVHVWWPSHHQSSVARHGARHSR